MNPLRNDVAYRNPHVHVSWEAHQVLGKENQTFTTPYLTSRIQEKWSKFKESRNKARFNWDKRVTEIVLKPGKKWMEDVLTVYTPMIWNNEHWVGLAINLNIGLLEILDPLPSLYGDRKVDDFMEPIVKTLPCLVKKVAINDLINFRGLKPFNWIRISRLYINERARDCGPVAIKFMEMHAFGDPAPHMSGITDQIVDEIRKQYTMDIYKTLVMHAYDARTMG